MKKKIFIATLVPLLILPFSSKLSYNKINMQLVNKQIESVNIHNPPDITPPKLENNDYIVMQATGYDLSVQSCGKSYSNPSRGIAKNGYNLNNKSHSESWTVSSNKFPLGTKLKLEFPKSHKMYDGIYVIRDTGNFGNNVLDVYLGDFGEKVNKDTTNFGRVDVKVWKIE